MDYNEDLEYLVLRLQRKFGWTFDEALIKAKKVLARRGKKETIEVEVAKDETEEVEH